MSHVAHHNRWLGRERSSGSKSMERMTQLKRVRASVIRTGPGCFLIALITFFCYRLQLNLTVTGFLYLIAIVLQSLTGSFISSALVSVVAVLCLDFFFTLPLFSLEVTSPLDILALISVPDYGAGRVPTHDPSARGGSDLGPPAASGHRAYRLAQMLLAVDPEEATRAR